MLNRMYTDPQYSLPIGILAVTEDVYLYASLAVC